jgi:polyisoprenyl-teichoic acid--peptidoglycan teichoic acid transferase
MAEPNPKKSAKELSPFWQGLLWSIAIGSIVTIFGVLGASLVLFSPFSAQITTFLTNITNKNQQTTPVQIAPSVAAANEPIDQNNNLSRAVNILVLGVEPTLDRDEAGENSTWSGRVDTIVLLRFDPVDRSLKLLSIPRDSWIVTGAGKAEKAGDLNQQGRVELTTEIIADNLNDLVIDRYIRLSPEALAELVDAVGGVEIYIPQAVSYQDRTQKLNIDLVAGWQTLDGNKALQFARYLDNSGDLGRVQRQQTLIAALYKRCQNPTILPRLSEIVRVLRQNIDTNLKREEMLALANFSSQLKPENLQMVLLSGKTRQDGSWRIDPRQRDKIIDRLFKGMATDNNNGSSLSSMRIAIQNTTTRSSLSQELLDYLVKQDFSNVYIVDDLPMELRETRIIAQQGNSDAADNLKTLLDFGKTEVSSTGDLNSDLTIQIGDDFILDQTLDRPNNQTNN